MGDDRAVEDFMRPRIADSTAADRYQQPVKVEEQLLPMFQKASPAGAVQSAQQADLLKASICWHWNVQLHVH